MKMEELCELCGKRARMLCESDQAKLCWECDRKVHGANFLVAKHMRILLCRLCQSPTPWKACGPSLTPTSSLCHRCCVPVNPIPPTTQSPNHHRVNDDDDGHSSDDYDDDDAESDDDDDDDYDVPEEEEEEEEGENQVVPWSSPSPSASPPPSTDGDISSATGSGGCRLPLKRFPDNSFIHGSDDEIGCSSSEVLPNDESSSMTVSTFRPLKQPRISLREATQWHNQRW